MTQLILITLVGAGTIACFAIAVHEIRKEGKRFSYLMDKWTGRREDPMTPEEEQEFNERLKDLVG